MLYNMCAITVQKRIMTPCWELVVLKRRGNFCVTKRKNQEDIMRLLE